MSTGPTTIPWKYADTTALNPVVRWEPTAALRWKGRALQQLWIASDGTREWREVEEVPPLTEDRG